MQMRALFPQRGAFLGVLALSVLLLAGCGGSSTQETLYWLDGAWPEETAADHGFDADGLRAVHEDDPDALAFAVFHQGKLIYEWYDAGRAMTAETPWQLFSGTKSFSSTLIGRAMQLGLVDIDDAATDTIPEWLGTESETLAVRHLLDGSSGRFWSFAIDFPGLGGSPQAADLTAKAIALDQQYEPGTTWQYNQMAMQCLDRVISASAGEATAAFAQRELFDKIGMTNSLIGTDEVGQMTMAWGIEASARDFARLGLLFLNDGVWNGERLIAPGFVQEAWAAGDDPNPAYGLMWWRNTDDDFLMPVSLEERSGVRFYPDGPDDMVAASGFLGQFLIVVPSEDLMIVRLGGGTRDGLLNDIYAGVAAARD